MRKFSPYLCALLALALAPSFCQADSVQSSCVGEVTNGNLNSAGCTPSPPPPASSPSGSGGLNPMQQMQLNGAYAVGQAAGAAFVQWLLSPAPDNSAQLRAQEAERQRLIEEQRQRLIEQERQRQAKIEQDKQEILGDWKGGQDEELAFKDFDARVNEELIALQNTAKTIDCGMTDVYKAAEKLGPQAKDAAADLSDHVLNAEKRLADTANTSGDSQTISSFDYDSMASWKKGRKRGGTQLTAHGIVTRCNNTGQRRILLSYSLSNGKKEISSGQESAILDSAGGVECQEVTGGAAKCMGQLHPESSKADYCPKPPPDQPLHPGPGGYDPCASAAKPTSVSAPPAFAPGNDEPAIDGESLKPMQ